CMKVRWFERSPLAPFAVAALTMMLEAASPPAADATLRYGPIQISGNLETQELVRLDDHNGSDLRAFDLVQQRNTFRFQYEHELVRNGQLLDMVALPGVKKAGFFAYYRFVYDSIYDIAPGASLHANDGSRGGSLDDTRLTNGDVVQNFSDRARGALAIENVLREVFVDLELSRLPVSFRIGRQQIVWGNTVNFRALDNTNALDLSWHLQQEAGILGRVGFSELRIPSWAVKALVKLPSVGPFANNYFEAYDIPFEFNPTRASFLPRPWGLRVRNPFRGGLVVDAGVSQGLPAGLLLLQPCFDFTGNRAANSADVDFSRAAVTGKCPTLGMQKTDLGQGLYDNHDPMDVNQFGARVGSTFAPIGLGFTINYKYQRHIADATGGTAAKSFGNFALANATDFIQFDGVPIVNTHETCDRLTGQCQDVSGFFRIPLEVYYPYVSIFGLSLDYFDEFTSAVYNFEFAATKGVPIANLNPAADFPGMRRAWEYEVALLVDRPTWIRFLNPRSTFTTLIQGNLSMIPDRKEVVCNAPGDCLGGDVGIPNANAIPEHFRTEATLDQRRRFEYLTIIAMQTFYWGGSLAPLAAMVVDWNNLPGFEWQIFMQYLPVPSLILEPGVRIFWTNGRTVDDRYGVTQNAGRNELQFKATYQF
ncbi:MAG: DUF1302 family protein, partial [Candidatus Binatia bacterium]